MSKVASTLLAILIFLLIAAGVISIIVYVQNETRQDCHERGLAFVDSYPTGGCVEPPSP